MLVEKLSFTTTGDEEKGDRKNIPPLDQNVLTKKEKKRENHFQAEF